MLAKLDENPAALTSGVPEDDPDDVGVGVVVLGVGVPLLLPQADTSITAAAATVAAASGVRLMDMVLPCAARACGGMCRGRATQRCFAGCPQSSLEAATRVTG
jgi:hypothetical protein